MQIWIFVWAEIHEFMKNKAKMQWKFHLRPVLSAGSWHRKRFYPLRIAAFQTVMPIIIDLCECLQMSNKKGQYQDQTEQPFKPQTNIH